MKTAPPALVAADGTPIVWPSPTVPADVARMAEHLPAPNKSQAAAFIRQHACTLVETASPANREHFARRAAHLLAIADRIDSAKRWRSGPDDWQRRMAINILAATISLRRRGDEIEAVAQELAERNASALGCDEQTLRRAILDERQRTGTEI